MERFVYLARAFLSTKAQNDWITLLAVVGVLSLIAASVYFAYVVFTTFWPILAAIGSGIKAVGTFVKLLIIHANSGQHFSDLATHPISTRLPSNAPPISRPQLSDTLNSTPLPPQNLLRSAPAGSNLQRGGSFQNGSGSMPPVSNPNVRGTSSHNGRRNPASQQLPEARHQLPQGGGHTISSASVEDRNPASQQLSEAHHQLPQGGSHMISSASVGHSPSVANPVQGTSAQNPSLSAQVGNLRSGVVHSAPLILTSSIINVIPPPTGNQAESEDSLSGISLDDSDPREPLLDAPRLTYIPLQPTPPGHGPSAEPLVQGTPAQTSLLLSQVVDLCPGIVHSAPVPLPPTPCILTLQELDDSGSIYYWFEGTPILNPNGDISEVKDAIYTGCLLERVIGRSDTTPVKELIVKFDCEDQEGSSISKARRHQMDHTLQFLYQHRHLSNVERVEVTLPYAMWGLETLSDGVVAHMPKLKTFHWDGHLSVFPKPWSRFANLPFRQLEHLKLTNCKLSLDDCIAILALGQSLKTFKVESLDESIPSFLAKTSENSEPGCSNLVLLEIASCVNIHPLLVRTAMTQLPHLQSIILSLPVGSNFTGCHLLPWRTAKPWSLHVKSKIDPTVQSRLRGWASQYNKQFVYTGSS